MPVSSSNVTTPNLPQADIMNLTTPGLPQTDLTNLTTFNLSQTEAASAETVDHEENVKQGFQLAPPIAKK